jgi:hypothetical protein
MVTSVKRENLKAIAARRLIDIAVLALFLCADSGGSSAILRTQGRVALGTVLYAPK